MCGICRGFSTRSAWFITNSLRTCQPPPAPQIIPQAADSFSRGLCLRLQASGFRQRRVQPVPSGALAHPSRRCNTPLRTTTTTTVRPRPSEALAGRGLGAAVPPSPPNMKAKRGFERCFLLAIWSKSPPTPPCRITYCRHASPFKRDRRRRVSWHRWWVSYRGHLLDVLAQLPVGRRLDHSQRRQLSRLGPPHYPSSGYYSSGKRDGREVSVPSRGGRPPRLMGACCRPGRQRAAPCRSDGDPLPCNHTAMSSFALEARKGKGRTGRGVQVTEALDQDEAGARGARRQLAVLRRAQVVRLAHAMPPRA